MRKKKEFSQTEGSTKANGWAITLRAKVPTPGQMAVATPVNGETARCMAKERRWTLKGLSTREHGKIARSTVSLRKLVSLIILRAAPSKGGMKMDVSTAKVP